jgi:hypothetical protein
MCEKLWTLPNSQPILNRANSLDLLSSLSANTAALCAVDPNKRLIVGGFEVLIEV